MAGSSKKDPDVQKAQALLRALGRDSANIDGREREIEVDGIEGPITRAGIARYKKDNNLAENAPMTSVLAHMENQVKNNPEVDKRMQGLAAQGPNASRSDGFTLQTFLNVMVEFIGALTGKKLNLDGIIGNNTTNLFKDFAKERKLDAPASAPAQATKPQAMHSKELAAIPSDNGLKRDQQTITVAPGQETSGVTPRPGDDDRTVTTVVVDGSASALPEPTLAPALPAEPAAETPTRPSWDGVEAKATSRRLPDAGPAAPERQPSHSYNRTFNQVGGVEALRWTLQERAELRREGVAPRVASQMVEQERTRQLIDQGTPPRDATHMARHETRMADIQERQGQRFERQAALEERRAAIIQEREARQTQRDGGAFAHNAAILGGSNGRDARAIGKIAEAGIGIFNSMTGGQGNTGSTTRSAQQMGRDSEILVRNGAILVGGSNNRETGAWGRIAGVIGRNFQIFEYPQRESRVGFESMRQPTQPIYDRSLEKEFRPAAMDGVTPDQRQQILVAAAATSETPQQTAATLDLKPAIHAT